MCAPARDWAPDPKLTTYPLVQGPNKAIMTAVGALAAAQLAFLPAAGACHLVYTMILSMGTTQWLG